MNKGALLVLFIVTACQQKITTTDIDMLNGYWEIERAANPDREKKDYTINPTIDYFKITDNKGFRTKVYPQFDGKYLTNKQAEQIKIVVVDDKTFIAYKTEYSQWREQIIEIVKDKLTVKNEDGIIYKYKRPTAFSIK
jgi:hypothetical protein